METTTRTGSEQNRSDSLAVVGVVLASLALVAAVVGVGFGLRAIDESKTNTGSAGAAAAPSTASVTLKEFSITPNTIEIASGGTIDVTNGGTIQHNLGVVGHADLATPLIDAGKQAKLTLTGLAPGDYKVQCTVPGHAEGGMVGTLKVVSGGAVGEAASSTGGTTATTQALQSADEIDAAAKARTAAFPAKTEGTGGQVLTPKVLPDGTKEFDISVDVVQWEVEPGKKVEAWAYNGQVPGPVIKVQNGDKVKAVFKNNLKESTTIHWHGIDVPNDQDGVPDVTQPQIKPGATYTYQFTAVGPAVGMYHAHSNSQKQVPMGLFAGMIITDLPIPNGLKVSQEIPMVLNDAGELGFTINGKSFPATAPITAKVGETVLIHYFNEGLQIHPMHLHGPKQLVIAKDGNPLAQPYLADTVLVGPGERYSVLVTPNRPGTWVWHCHILTHAERTDGFFGMTTALVVPQS